MGDARAQLIRESINNLRNIDQSTNSEYQFIVGSEDGTSPSEYIIYGRLIPKATSTIYGKGAIQIKIVLVEAYPFDPPNVYSQTRVFHPNVDDKTDGRIYSQKSYKIICYLLFFFFFFFFYQGQICTELLETDNEIYAEESGLVDLVTHITDILDEPDLRYPMNAGEKKNIYLLFIFSICSFIFLCSRSCCFIRFRSNAIYNISKTNL